MPALVTFSTRDGATVEADLYEGGSHTVVLAHGKVFDKESWSDQAIRLNDSGLTVLVPNFRGYGKSAGPDGAAGYAHDVAAAVAFARENGAETVSIIGGSMGAAAVADAVSMDLVDNIHTLILLAPRVLNNPRALTADHVTFVVSEEEDIVDMIQAAHAATPGEKTLKVYPGAAHAQHLFKGPHAEDLMSLILAQLAD